MSDSVAIWIISAVLLFWVVGAYKRLVRLRSQASAAFAPLEAQFAHYAALVQNSFASVYHDDGPAARAGLVGAALQLEASLKEARAQPLDVQAIRALETAHEALCASWARVRNEPPDLAGAPLPDALQLQWEHIARDAGNARAEFNRRVRDYNAAIRQFPAGLLAWLFGFRPAHLIRDSE
jgi:LemA protein